MANYSNLGERLRPPDAIPGPVDTQLVRVWIRRKYLDRAWYADFGSASGSESKSNDANAVVTSNSSGTTYQPTKVSIPPKKKGNVKSSVAAQPETDLLGGMWDDTTTTNTNNVAPMPAAASPAPANNDADWDAFGANRANSNAGANDPFATSNSNAPKQGNSFQADFGQMQPSSPPAPQQMSSNQYQNQQQGMTSNQSQGFNNNNNNMQQGFNANFPQQNQMQNMPSTQQPFNANFSPQNQMQNMSSAQQPFNTNFPQQNQMQNIPSQPGFDANFQQQTNGQSFGNNNNMQINMNNSSQQPPPSFDANFQTQGQGQSMPSPQQQQQFGSNMQQNQQSNMTPTSQQQPSFNADFQQQNQMQNMDNFQQSGFNNNGNQQQMLPPTIPQMSPPQPPKPTLDNNVMNIQPQGQQPSFNANFGHTGQERPLSPDKPPQPPQLSGNGQGQNMQPNMQMNAPTQHQDMPPSLNAGVQQQGMQQMQNQSNMGMQINQNNNDMQLNENMMQNDSNMIPSPTSMSNSDVPKGFSTDQSSTVLDIVQEEQPKSSVMIGMTNANDAFDAFSNLSIISNNTPQPENGMQESGDITNTKPASMYKVGQKLIYKDSQGNASAVEVIKVHLDDDLVPFYDIRMLDGREKQTDNAHLQEASIDNTTVVNDISEKLASVTNLINGMNYEHLEKVEQFIKSMMN